jgi:energy-coupling factor transport system ATP-binding protein
MIEIIDVTHSYIQHQQETRHTALNNISLRIREGEFVSLMGRNSSGKTTLARCINALIIPEKGSVLVDKLSSSEEQNIPLIRKRVGMVFQNPENQIVSTTVEREIAFGLENLGVSSGVMREVVEGTMDRFRLTRYRKHPPHLLSGGEKQRLALAAVMAMNPKYLILDEPTSMLDPQGCEELMQLLEEIHHDNENKPTTEQITILMITQYPDEAFATRRLVVLDKGNVVFDDAPHVVFQNVEQMKEMGLEVPVEYELSKHLLEKGYSPDVIRDILKTS